MVSIFNVSIAFHVVSCLVAGSMEGIIMESEYAIISVLESNK